MFTITYKKILVLPLLVMLFLTAAQAQAKVDPTKKYQSQGQITAIDRTKRLLTIENNLISLDNDKNTSPVGVKTYELAIGAKLKNMPKSLRYSGLKNITEGTLVYFNLKRGTEKNSVPVISEMWVEFQ